jgi:hypothetical protein
VTEDSNDEAKKTRTIYLLFVLFSTLATNDNCTAKDFTRHSGVTTLALTPALPRASAADLVFF